MMLHLGKLTLLTVIANLSVLEATTLLLVQELACVEQHGMFTV